MARSKDRFLMAAWAAGGLLMLAVGGACDVPRNPPPPPPPNPTPAPAPSNAGLVGFAAVNSLGQNGTTGGAGGPTVTARTPQEFIDFIARPGPMIVRVEGMLRLPGPLHDVASNKTIQGVGARAGIFGAGLMIGLRNTNASLPANAIRNVIVRNLTITDCPDDCINVQEFSHHIWIDHNDLARQTDGALDIKRGSDFITVSWNHFRESDKNALLGHSDNNAAQDVGRPVHVFNNYYLNVSSYGVASQQNAGVLVEGNFFENTKRPTRNDVGGTTGRIVQRMNVFVNSDPPFSSGSVMEPSRFYAYRLDPASNVPSQVRAGAGVGKLGL
jgi:pectate lyase